MAYRIILLAYDGSIEGRRALLEGTEIAKRFDAMTHLLAVIKTDVGTAMAQGLAAAEPGEKTQYYQGTLSEGVKFLGSQGLEAEGHAVHGEPVDEIVKFAKRVSADLVVVGHRTRGTLARWWTTPTCMSLLDKLECSLLIGMQEADLSVLPKAVKLRRD